MNWNRTTRHFGDVYEGEELFFTFHYLGDKEYDKHSTSCGCTSGNWINNTLQVRFKPRNVPVSVLDTGVNNYQVTKSISVFFKDGSSDRLYLKAIVYEK